MTVQDLIENLQKLVQDEDFDIFSCTVVTDQTRPGESAVVGLVVSYGDNQEGIRRPYGRVVKILS